MPTMESTENFNPICLYPSHKKGMFNTAIKTPSWTLNMVDPTMLMPVTPPSDTWLGMRTDSRP